MPMWPPSRQTTVHTEAFIDTDKERNFTEHRGAWENGGEADYKSGEKVKMKLCLVTD